MTPRKPLRGSSAPSSSILNPAFRYVPATHTNVGATFNRIRQEHPDGKQVEQQTPVHRSPTK